MIPGIEPIIHAVNYLNGEEKYFLNMLCAFNVLVRWRKAKDIDNSIEEINKKNADALVSVCESEVNRIG